MTDYKKILEESYAEIAGREEHEEYGMSRLEYISEYIFDFTTYQSDMAEQFAMRALDVCLAITEGTTFEYIKRDQGIMWFLLMCNMPFIYPKLNWGGSIRGAWWDHVKSFELNSCGIYIDGEQETELIIPRNEWDDFIRAMTAFACSVVEK